MEGSEKRKYRRLPLKFGISCRRIGSTVQQSQTGRTMNVGTGGLYFQTTDDAFKSGTLLKVRLSIPPTAGLLEFGGRIAGFARVLRNENLNVRSSDSSPSPRTLGVALEFCQRPRLCT